MNDKELREAIDACRPGKQDLSLPEFAELAERLNESAELRSTYHRVQLADHALALAIDDVPLPANLADRLLSRLQAAAQQSTDSISTAVRTAEVQSSTATETAPAPMSARSSHRVGRRIGLAAMAAGLLAMAGWWFFQPRPISSEDMPQLVADCYDQLGSQWQSMQTAPKGLAAPSALIRPRDWQDVSEAFGHDAAAYRFVLGGGSQAVLFAVNIKLDRVPSMPPARPQPTTGARSIAIWQTGGVAYVLVVKGDGRDYQRLFKSQPGTTA